MLFLNDGLIQLEVTRVSGDEVECRVVVGGELRSRKGLNVPGIDLGISAFTERDRECLKFALEHGVDAVSQSFVESAADLEAVRDAARALGGAPPLILAKIERSRALDRVDEILAAADGLMVARGDLGVEVPIERMAVLQKMLIRKAVRAGKPVITATQMLESMTVSRQPTRAEATDVANAILDGTDCVMLSGESATGKFPVEAVRTLARIAAATEPHRDRLAIGDRLRAITPEMIGSVADLFALSVETLMECSSPAAVVVPTRSGATARSIGRFRLPVWIAAPTESRGDRPPSAVQLRGGADLGGRNRPGLDRFRADLGGGTGSPGPVGHPGARTVPAPPGGQPQPRDRRPGSPARSRVSLGPVRAWRAALAGDRW